MASRKQMWIRIVIGLLCIAPGLGSATAGESVEAATLDYLYQLNDMGQHWTAESFHGKLTVVNFWATWCPPCIEEMPLLEGFHLDFEAKGLRVVGVTKFFEVESGDKTEAEELDDIQAILTVTRVTFANLVAGDAAAWEAYGVSGVPSTVLVGRDGEIVASAKGKKGTKKILKKARKMLESSGGEPR